MSDNNEMVEIERRVMAALTMMVRASSELARTLIQVRAQALRDAARAGQESARQARARARAAQQADAAVYRAVWSPQWWRQASAEDIAQVWRAAETWAAVDPRAAAARRLIVERLAKMGVNVDLDAPVTEDETTIGDAVDQAVTEVDPTVIEGQFVEVSDDEVSRLAQARERMAEHVRAVWPEDTSEGRADRVIGSKAWVVLANKLAQLEAEGHDVRALLRGVPEFVDRAHTPAAFAYRAVVDQVNEQTKADAARADERDQRSGENLWRETGVDGRAAEHAETARSVAETEADRAAAHEDRAAQLAAQSYPEDTAVAVADVGARPDKLRPTKRPSPPDRGRRRPATAEPPVR